MRELPGGRRFGPSPGEIFSRTATGVPRRKLDRQKQLVRFVALVSNSLLELLVELLLVELLLVLVSGQDEGVLCVF